MNSITCILSLMAIVAVTTGFPSGAPRQSCDDMMPRHASHKPKTYGSPYRIVFRSSNSNQPAYVPGDEFAVHIESRDNEWFRGFLLQARTTEGEKVGEFFTDNSRYTQTVCDDQALTHKVWGARSSISGIWRAPDESKGDLVFTATIVKRYDEYWTNVVSAVIKDITPPIAPPQGNTNGSCTENDLVSLSEKRPLVAILCGEDSHCPCGWRCCQWCPAETVVDSSKHLDTSDIDSAGKEKTPRVDGQCYGYSICREPASEQPEPEQP